MFKKFVSFIRSLFGGKPKPTPNPEPEPSQYDNLTDLAEDSSDVKQDTVITVNVEDVDPFADDDKAGAFDEGNVTIETPEPVVTEPDPVPEPDPEPVEPEEPVVEEPPVVEPPKPKHKPRYLWCLDNGHGKKQAGKRSPVWLEDEKEKQFFEYEFNRDVVERIMKALDEKGVKYYDIVPDFNEVGSFLKERVARANKKQSSLPKIFVSVHANAGPAPTASDWTNDSVKGVETWFAHNSRKGKKIAAVFHKHLLNRTNFKDRKLRSTKQRALYVLIKTIMPAILTENGFFNNEEEVKELMKSSVRQKVADAHVDAIMEIEKNGIG